MSGDWVQIVNKNKEKKIIELPKEEKVEEIKELVFNGIRYFDEEWNIYYGNQISDIICDFQEIIQEENLPFMNTHFSVKGYHPEKTMRNYLKLFIEESDKLYEEIEKANEQTIQETEEENYYNEHGEYEYKKKYNDA